MSGTEALMLNPTTIDLLGQNGSELVDGCPPSNSVLKDSQARRTDVHRVRFDEKGNGVSTAC